jgi:peptide/nickel transport system ATP-binding protein
MLMDTIPDLEMSGREREPVGGEVPNPINPPSGCPFHPRCPFANDRCKTEVPQLKRSPEGSMVSCHGVEEGRIPAEDRGRNAPTHMVEEAHRIGF